MDRRLILLFIVIFLAACAQTTATPTLPLPLTATSSATLIPSPTVTATASATLTASPTSTASSTPTETATPTLTPTPDLPVVFGTSLPQPSQPISATNVAGIVELARYGNARIYRSVLTSDHSHIFNITADGIKVYQTENMQRVAWFADLLPPRLDDWGNLTIQFSASADGSRFTFIDQYEQVQVYDLQDGLIYRHTFPIVQEAWMASSRVNYYSLAYTWVAISPDGQLLALPYVNEYGSGGRWQIIELSGFTQVATGIGSDGIFSPAGTYLAASSGSNVLVYRTTDWQVQNQFGMVGAAGRARGWGFSPDDHYLTVEFPNRVALWEVETRYLRELPPVTNPEAWMGGVSFSADGSQLVVNEGFNWQSEVVIWNLADYSIASRQTREQAGISDYDYYFLTADGFDGYDLPLEQDGSGYHVSTWGGSVPSILDLGNDQLTMYGYFWDQQQNRSVAQICVFSFSPAGQLPCQQFDGSLSLTTDGHGQFYTLWQTDDEYKVAVYEGLEQVGSPLAIISTDGYDISLLGVSPDHTLLIYAIGTGTEGVIQVLDLSSDHILMTEQGIGSVDFTAGSSRILIGYKVYDARLNAIIFRLRQGSSPALSPDGQVLVYRFYNAPIRWAGLKFFEPLSQREFLSVPGDEATLGTPLTFSPDGKLLATTYSNQVYLLEAATGTVLFTWPAHLDKVSSVTFSPDGTMIVTTGADGFIKIWGIWP